MLGSDRSIAIGPLVGSARDTDIGVIWFDVHDDFSTPGTSPSGNVHGMPLVVMLGTSDSADVEWTNAASLKEESVTTVGLHSVDDAEAEATRNNDITVYTMSGIDERGTTDVTNDTLDVATGGTDDVHVGLGLDQPDPHEAPRVGTPVYGDVTYHEAHVAIELVARSEAIHSFEPVEVNLVFNKYNETATLATKLAISAFGKRIL